MASDIQICNLALSNLGCDAFIQALDEQSKEATILNLWYAHTVQYVLRDFPWPFATGYKQLALVEESPNDDWAYSYRYPDGCVYVRRITRITIGRKDTHPWVWRVGGDDAGRLIYTQCPDPCWVEYTRTISDPEEYDPLYVEALSWYLASRVASPLARFEGAAKAALKNYDDAKKTAEIAALNESQEERPQEAENIEARWD